MHTFKIFRNLLFVICIFFISCENSPKDIVSKKEEISLPTPEKLPNIVFIYLDDLGYGDVGSYGATAIKTPHIDNWANGGVQFTNGYASSATCSPSRYALLTGIYPWRNKKAKILPGTAPLIIDTAQPTIPRMLKSQGYHTGIVGKWHLGLGNGNVDWNKRISPGPNEVGFDYSYIMAATQDRVPTVYIENGNVDNLDPNDPILIDYDKNFEGEATGTDNPELLRMKGDPQHSNSINNGVPRIGYMKGGQAAKWIDEDMADHFLEKAQSYVQKHSRDENPFFLYYALQQPHVPRTPHQRFIGATDMGPRGDVIAEADWCVGAFIKTLEKEGILENTLIVFSSDNGPVINDGYEDQSIERLGNHKPWGKLRGGKYSLFEAGTRVPFITYWKGKIKPRKSDALVSQVDLYSSLASLVNAEKANIDSENLLSAFLGESTKGRENLIIEATGRTALRKGNWIMIPPYKGAKINKTKNIETGNDKVYQLYDLSKDIGQQTNLADSHEEKLQELVSEFEGIRGKE